MYEHIDEMLHELVQPTRVDITRAKKGAIKILQDGKVHMGDWLARAMPREKELSPPSSSPGGEVNIDALDKDHPSIQYVRLYFAGLEALAELLSAGVLIEAEGGTQTGQAGPRHIQWFQGGTSAASNVSAGSPSLDRYANRGYRLSRFMLKPNPWLADADVFHADLESLQLDPRTTRCLKEALAAYQRHLYLACASLLGAVSEGAWYALGETLRGASKSFDKSLDGASAARFQKRLARELEDRGVHAVHELVAHASLYRELRNYGVHPRTTSDLRLEKYFSEEACGELLLMTHHYLASLTSAANLLRSNKDH
jgi:hypothetical protein